jgi:breast cancer 2 susceptibility protein
VQLHDLHSTLLKRLMAAEQGAQQGHHQQQQQGQQQQQHATELPLDSTTCTEFKVPDVSAAAAPAGGTGSPNHAMHAVTAGAAAPGQPGQPVDQLAEAHTVPLLLGWQELRQQLVEAGANPAYATEAWVANHYRWVVWKLARLQLLASGGIDCGCRPPTLLTAAVVLDELKLRWVDTACRPPAVVFSRSCTRPAFVIGRMPEPAEALPPQTGAVGRALPASTCTAHSAPS